MEISLTEENYIKAIFSINRANDGEGASTNQLSAHLQNKAASVTDMLKRLSAKKLIHYEKYKNVFLTEKLHFRWDEVHDIAEQLEHVKSEELIKRLDLFLGCPKFDPHGDPIPDAKGVFNSTKAKPLSRFKQKGAYVFMGVLEHSPAFLQHLSALGLKLGDTLVVEDIIAFDNSVKVKINKRAVHFLSEKVSAGILVDHQK